MSDNYNTPMCELKKRFQSENHNKDEWLEIFDSYIANEKSALEVFFLLGYDDGSKYTLGNGFKEQYNKLKQDENKSNESAI